MKEFLRIVAGVLIIGCSWGVLIASAVVPGALVVGTGNWQYALLYIPTMVIAVAVLSMWVY